MNLAKTLLLHLLKNQKSSFAIVTRHYAGKPKALTESQIQLQKYASEMQFKAKTSIQGTPYNFHDAETSIRYMSSEAYKLAYGQEPVWKKYVRNYGGHVKPKKTRKQCIRGGVYGSGNPCPICRDEYLVVSHKNLKLLHQFVSPDTGNLRAVAETNVCMKQQENLQMAFEQACNLGLIDHYVPFRSFDYSVYYDDYEQEKKDTSPSLLLNVLAAAKRKNTNDLLNDITEEDLNRS